ncbi:hypothetical protein P3T76_003024 [Phytophthora citrophthora]|uniref:Uncharacterized protein n=1 Tax=Phytophthora citrophthora TaxID=4793 RepID=A0AAD9GXP2_9STRA|nr:hypothetical protein P3T76_003024 [Phytophthora citrophthora]
MDRMGWKCLNLLIPDRRPCFEMKTYLPPALQFLVSKNIANLLVGRFAQDTERADCQKSQFWNSKQRQLPVLLYLRLSILGKVTRRNEFVIAVLGELKNVSHYGSR